jgi:cell division protein FtsB
MTLPKIFQSKWLLLPLLITLAGAGYLEWQQIRERHAINQEIAAMEAQEQELLQRNTDLKSSLELLQNQSYQEKLAREQLGLQKAGEIVIQFPKASDTAAATTTSTAKTRGMYYTNIRAWWEYVFQPSL